MNKLKDFLNKYLNKQTFQLFGIVIVILLSIAAIVGPSLLNKQKNLSLQNSKAAEIPESILPCDVQFTISLPTPTLTPTNSPTPTPRLSPTPTNTPTPTLTPTLTPTPTLSCKNLDIGLVIDRSGTMSETESDGRKKLVWAKEAAVTFVNAIINTSTTSVKVSVDSFGAQGNENDPILGNLTLGSTYRSTLDASLSNDLTGIIIPAINSVVHIEDGTCIQCGINIANKQLTSSVNRKVVILMSDGLANHIWTGKEPGSTISKQVSVDQASEGRANGIEYRVIGYRGKTSGIDETTLKKIACADPNDSVCVNNNYTYKPNAVDWSNAFLNILNSLCQ